VSFLILDVEEARRDPKHALQVLLHYPHLVRRIARVSANLGFGFGV
jgi:hypothetical protein